MRSAAHRNCPASLRGGATPEPSPTSYVRAHAIAFWLVVETRLATNSTEYKSFPVVCGRVSRPSDLDGHPTHGVHHCHVRHHVGSRGSSTGCVGSLVNVAAPELENLTHDTK